MFTYHFLIDSFIAEMTNVLHFLLNVHRLQHIFNLIDLLPVPTTIQGWFIVPPKNIFNVHFMKVGIFKMLVFGVMMIKFKQNRES